ncbi:hypothetical protein KI659_07540 [Litoribacter alkaliphilus]|uniref:DUF4175 family protein n=1 Tax=Litoribacter ruber TaxID=702568 RepID=A0AAP2G3V4_9BACT|nr:hypothetical protein [Litoribacter alkaliphilus]MBS9523865.1 hypothetical protein [Litoribacter alkaliphilus]
MNKLRKSIEKVQWQLRANALLKAFLMASVLGLLSFAFLDSEWVAVSLAGLVFMGLSYVFGAFAAQRESALAILHRNIDQMEYSLDLLSKNQLTIAEQLQLERLNQKVGNTTIPSVWKQNLIPFLGLLVFAVGIYFLSSYLPQHQITEENQPLISSSSPADRNERPALQLEKTSIHITPPPYTGLKPTKQREMDLSVMAGSQVEWNLDFNWTDDLQVDLVNQAGERLSFSSKDGSFSLREKALSSGIYSIQVFQGEEEHLRTPFHKIEVIQDKAPVIEPKQKEVYTYHSIRDEQRTTLSAKVSDDFLVTEVYLVATLARGSGENVKFRETRIPFEKTHFKSAQMERTLDFKALNFRPGDELYYYWAARDNRQPEANTARSETFFIKYRDTTAMSEAELTTMAVQVLPEYFRSQRQIIIDTEKLIAERGKKAEKAFNSTSNEIGYDQKLLRMRYGQYLGEEFESSAGGGDPMADGDGDLLEGFMHKHDQEGEHEPDHGHSHDHGHGHEHEETNSQSKDDGGLGNLLENFIHAHEDDEMNTFYEESTRGILKAALENMWQSELHLRMFEPEKALPYQNKALELLKSVQQKSRVYVRRTGFDPPPIKEAEKRLSGDLDKIHVQDLKTLEFDTEKTAQLAAKILGFLERETLAEADRQVVREFGNYWTVRMQTSGMDDWNQLISLQKLSSGEALSFDEKAKLQQKLTTFLKNQPRPKQSRGNKQLERNLWKNLP